MALVDPAVFADKDVRWVYVTDRPSEAERAARVLSDNEIDYTVEVTPSTRWLFGVVPVKGNFFAFRVISGQAAFCRHALRKAGLLKEPAPRHPRLERIVRRAIEDELERMRKGGGP